MAFLDDILEELVKDLNSVDIVTAMENFNFRVNNNEETIDEAEYTRQTEHFKLEILDIDEMIKKNDMKQITNPVFLSGDNVPTPDGLLSNEIFGITQTDRAGIFAYISLDKWFIDPSCYKCWSKIDKKVIDVIHKNGTFSIDGKGFIVEDPSGKNGVKFLKDNIDKINFKTSDSLKRDLRVKYLENNRKKMFINKYPVIPPFYRDINTGKRSIGIGGVNKLYSQLIQNVNILNTTYDYGFDMSGPMEGRVQELLVAIYDWFAGNSNKTIQVEEGVGISGKSGILRRAALTKTTNYTARLVISAPDVRSNRPEDMMVNYDYSAIPLHAAIACYRPFVQFFVRKFFESIFIGTETIPVIDKTNNVTYVTPNNPLIEFSDEKIIEEMEKFIHSKNNRLVPVVFHDIEGKEHKMAFKGNFLSEKLETEGIYSRQLTWCDIFYVAACQSVKNRMAIITRYPVDTKFNSIVTKLVVSSTKETEPMYYNNESYKFYPKIRQEDIGADTGNMFIDTMKICNIFLPGMVGDYDGDTVSVKGVYTDEANKELLDFVNDKANFTNLKAESTRSSSGQSAQSVYNLTLILDSDSSKIKDVVL